MTSRSVARPFRLKRVLRCALHTLANLINGIAQWISQSYYIVDSHTRLSHCESLTLHSYCLPWSWGEESVYTLLCHNIIYPSTLRQHSLPFDHILFPSNTFFTLLYSWVKWTCFSHLINLSTIDANFSSPPFKHFRGAAENLLLIVWNEDSLHEMQLVTPPPSVYQGGHRGHSHDSMNQTFPLCLCKWTKTGWWEGLGLKLLPFSLS